ncbi:hypothetical protein DFS33DRAFT_1383427 [Desarmillaria ectypa]|nr:hypothetical protein DFS33DRAFT_1383427 [Desarmillaria ectypa]
MTTLRRMLPKLAGNDDLAPQREMLRKIQLITRRSGAIHLLPPVATPLVDKEVKAVTKGVKEVELEDKEAAPESVPLPEEEPGELDEGANTDSIASTPPAEEPDTAPENPLVAAGGALLDGDKVVEKFTEKVAEIASQAVEKTKADVLSDDVKAESVVEEKAGDAVDTDSSR